MDDGVEQIFAFLAGSLPEIFVHVHLELKRHSDDRPAVFELADEFLADISALFSFFR